MKKVFLILGICLATTILKGQASTVNKKLKDFPDKFDLSTPLKAGITFSYLTVNGKESLWRNASAYIVKAYFPKGKKDRTVSKSYQDYLLNSTIKECIVYKDTVACMITQNEPEFYTVRMLGFEDGKWLNVGENIGESLKEAREQFYKKAPALLTKIRNSAKVKRINSDTLAFVNYVKNKGLEPKPFLLNVVKKYPLVIYGELHRRKVSWDFLSAVLNDPKFNKYVGTIFVELPACMQSELDKFYSLEELQPEILLNVLRSEQIYGWWDRGEYEFLINVWKLNKTLPLNKKIRVISVDEQPPYHEIFTADDYKTAELKLIDRNTKMANVVEQHIKTKKDKRNCLFTVGYAHAMKSKVPGGYSAAIGQNPALTAGAQLTQRLSAKNVFIILQHVPMGTNYGALGLVRHGMFDLSFEKNGNKPIAFELKNTPFGAEPFDVDYEQCFDSRIGNFEDNFDAYMFINPLKNEDSDYILYDIWTDNFVKEMKRRASIANFNLNRWLKTKDEITKEKIIEMFKKKYEGKKRWLNLYE